MEDMEHGGFMGGIQSLGIVNALKTGDLGTDIFIAMCLPIFLRFLFTAVEGMQRKLNFHEWERWWHGRNNQHQRFIVHRSTTNTWGGRTTLDSDAQNAVLIKAIQLYLHHECKLVLESADLDLVSINSRSQTDRQYHYDSDCEDQSSSGKTLVGMLSKYTVVKKPPNNQWHSLGLFPCLHADQPCYPVELRIEENAEPVGKDGTQHLTTLRLHFVSSGPTSIDTFIDKAYSWYMDELRSLEDYSRYLYEIQPSSRNSTSRNNGGDDYGNEFHDGPVHVRYKLSDEKTFESLFFQQKESLLNLVRHFTEKSGKYAVKGYPHKLGLLLHGPPGTGKTSLIKALAHLTNRSIVNVPLAKISTNSELMSVFFDNTYYIKGEDVPMKLGFKDVIFVMEDVDACSKIVRRRDGRKTADIMYTEHIDIPAPKSIWRMLLETNEADCRELVELLMEKSNTLKQEALKPQVLRSLAQRMMVLPGLGLVGESNGEEAVQKLGEEAIESATNLMNSYSVVDQFVSTHARSIKALLDAGAEVDEGFVDELLGNPIPPAKLEDGVKVPFAPPRPTSFASMPKANLSRELSYTKYSDDEVHLSTVDHEGVAGGGSTMERLVKSIDANEAELTSDSVAIGPKDYKTWSKAGKDKLNLTGLLNVLDGVVDTPGRILIMTTNHPEMLDAALIRPGRIDKKLMLGFMTSPDVIAMLEHYFQTTLSDSQRHRVQDSIIGNASESRPQLDLTPAQVEQLAAEHDDVENMISVLEKKGASTIAPRINLGKSSLSSIRFNV